MGRSWASKPEDLIALIGPGIGSCCYEVGDSVRQTFLKSNPEAEACFRPGRDDPSDPRWMLDLLAANRQQLVEAGLAADRIYALNACTVCDSEHFFSYRRDGAATGRMLSLIGVTE
jgi:hypothetical protein